MAKGAPLLCLNVLDSYFWPLGTMKPEHFRILASESQRTAASVSLAVRSGAWLILEITK